MKKRLEHTSHPSETSSGRRAWDKPSQSLLPTWLDLGSPWKYSSRCACVGVDPVWTWGRGPKLNNRETGSRASWLWVLGDQASTTVRKSSPLGAEVSGPRKALVLKRGVLLTNRRTSTRTGSALSFYSNSGSDCVFFPLAGVQPHRLLQLATLKIISAQEMKGIGSIIK